MRSSRKRSAPQDEAEDFVVVSPTREELIRRQASWANVRTKLEKRFHSATEPSEKRTLRDALALTASEMYALGESILNEDSPDIQKNAERVLYLYRTIGLQVRMVSQLHGAVGVRGVPRTVMDSLDFEKSGLTGLASTYFREGLEVKVFNPGLGFLYDPRKVLVSAAYKRDAWTNPGEDSYSKYYLESKSKFYRKFVSWTNGRQTVADYARYPTSRFEGHPWSVEFPPHTISALSYKASRVPEYAPGKAKDFEAYNEVVIKPKGESFANAIIGIVYVPKHWHAFAITDVVSIAAAVRASMANMFLPIMQYDNYVMTYLPDRYFLNYSYDKPMGYEDYPLRMSRTQYEVARAENIALALLVQKGFADAFLFNYTDAGYEGGKMKYYSFMHLFAVDKRGKEIALSLQALAGVIAAKSYLNVSYDDQGISGASELTPAWSDEYHFVVEGVVYAVPTFGLRVRLERTRLTSTAPGGVDTILSHYRPSTVPKHNATLQKRGSDLNYLVRYFVRMANAYARPDIRPRPDMFFLLASENPTWRGSLESLGVEYYVDEDVVEV